MRTAVQPHQKAMNEYHIAACEFWEPAVASVEVPYDDEVKCKFIQSLGSNPSASGLFNNYDNHSRNLDGVANVFHVLGQKQGAFHWMPDGSLEIRDTYLFTGMDDLGAAPTLDQ